MRKKSAEQKRKLHTHTDGKHCELRLEMKPYQQKEKKKKFKGDLLAVDLQNYGDKFLYYRFVRIGNLING